MCGIAGIIKIHDPKDGTPPPPLEAIPEAWLDILDESIKHRGPDGQGRFRDRTVRSDGSTVDIALVHRRLSIIDHDGGHQPMVHDGDRLRPDLTYQPGDTPIIASEIEPNKPIVAVVFNGCIYNHRELRTELEAAGHVFETDHSDTEVLVHAYQEWDGESDQHLDAMYAISIWDCARGMLRCTNDHAGEKPLWSGSNPPHYDLEIFSSVPSAITRLTELFEIRVSHVDGYTLQDWCRYGYSPSTPTINSFAGFPGTWYETSFDGEQWHPLGERDESGSRYGWCRRGDDSLTPERIDELLTNSIRARLTADVPIGCFLSGGIDSGLIAAIAQRELGNLTTFTVRMPDPKFDESTAAKESADHIGTSHCVIDCDPNPAQDLVTLIEQLGVPFGDSSLLPTYWVSKGARQHMKVALSGDGADELFGGYARHTIVNSATNLRWLLSMIPTSLLNEQDPASKTTKLARLVRSARRDGYIGLLSIFQSHDLRRLIQTESKLFDIKMPFFMLLNNVLRYDFEHYLPNDLLRKTDTASMAVGLEVRAPFLARDLVEAAMRTPLDTLMPNGDRKGLLKQVARKYLPDHIVDRPKQGFAIPIGEWFRTDYGDMRQLLYDHLESADPFPGLADAGVNINMKFVNQMLREHDAAGEKSINPWHGRDHSQRLYMMLVLSIWSKWLDRIQPESDEKTHA